MLKIALMQWKRIWRAGKLRGNHGDTPSNSESIIFCWVYYHCCWNHCM